MLCRRALAKTILRGSRAEEPKKSLANPLPTRLHVTARDNRRDSLIHLTHLKEEVAAHVRQRPGAQRPPELFPLQRHLRLGVVVGRGSEWGREQAAAAAAWHGGLTDEGATREQAAPCVPTRPMPAQQTYRQDLADHVDEVGRAPDGQHPLGPHHGELVAVLGFVLMICVVSGTKWRPAAS